MTRTPSRLHTVAMLAAGACAASLAFAQSPAKEHENEHDHDHSAPGHTHDRPAQADPAKETNVDYFWRKSDEAFHAGDYERAVSMHRAIVALAPGDVQSYGVASWLLWSLGKGEEARAFIARGLKANPQNWDMWHEAGQHYELQKLSSEALEAYKKALALMPQDTPATDAQMARRRLAHSAERGGDLPLSVQTWRDLVRDFPQEVVNKNNLARVEAKGATK
jgi:tetratricopeptide (TPR) repeat protein